MIGKDFMDKKTIQICFANKRLHNHRALKYLCQLVALVALASAFFPTESQAGSEGIPRLWRASLPGDKKDTVFYILAISHAGSQVEYDEYFDAVVVPAYLGSDVLHFEDGGKLPTNTQPECKKSLSSPAGIAILNQARATVGRNSVEYFRRLAKFLPAPANDEALIRSNAENFTQGLSEYSLVQVLRAQYIYLQPQSSTNDKEPVYPFQPVVERLVQLKPSIQIKSMDEPDDMARAFCSAGEKRAGIIDEYMKTYDLTRLSNDDGESLDSAAKEIDKRMRSALEDQFLHLDISESAFTCFRTHLWEQRFKDMLDGKVHFLALGAGHLFPSTGPVASCQGLLQDLHENGFMVEKVR
ncbi:hypothetical protein [Ideonella sp. B508-1]|uniref:hypothetical protein n=1 Tax=Ideonella sp. B508-1 TaxID=137716 RepID=UPI0011D204ED|nr:hypothetical protein [Ideonella sp. B508-1]